VVVFTKRVHLSETEAEIFANLAQNSLPCKNIYPCSVLNALHNANAVQIGGFIKHH
jgi:hypothetical protein